VLDWVSGDGSSGSGGNPTLAKFLPQSRVLGSRSRRLNRRPDGGLFAYVVGNRKKVPKKWRGQNQ